MSYKNITNVMLKRSIDANRITTGGANGHICHLSGKLTLKIFAVTNSETSARSEYGNLQRLQEIPSIKTPEPYAIINMGDKQSLQQNIGMQMKPFHRNDLFNFDIYAVLMERIHGKALCDLNKHELDLNRAELRKLFHGLLDANIYRPDFKALDILCEPDGSVAMVDTHDVRIEPDLQTRFQSTIEHYFRMLIKNCTHSWKEEQCAIQTTSVDYP